MNVALNTITLTLYFLSVRIFLFIRIWLYILLYLFWRYIVLLLPLDYCTMFEVHHHKYRLVVFSGYSMILKFLWPIPCYMYLINTAITYRLYLRTKPIPYSCTYEPRLLHTVCFDNKSHSILPVSKNHGSAFKNEANSILFVPMNHNYCILPVKTSHSILPVSKNHITILKNQTDSILPVPMNHGYCILSVKTSHSILPVSKNHSTIFKNQTHFILLVPKTTTITYSLSLRTKPIPYYVYLWLTAIAYNIRPNW